MSRDRSYVRKMRAKHIRRKKRITQHYRAWDEYPYYKHDGMYSKNKVHCSCPLCKSKAYYGKHVETIQELKHQFSPEELEDAIEMYNIA